METTLSGLLGTGRGSEVPTTAASLDFLSGTSKGERPDWSFGEAGAAKEKTPEIVVLERLWVRTLPQVKGSFSKMLSTKILQLSLSLNCVVR